MGLKRWQGGTSTAWSTPANWIEGSIPVANDDVQMNAADKTTNFCLVGPTVAIVINSLIITSPANTSGSYLTSNGGNITISGAAPLAVLTGETLAYNFRYIDEAMTVDTIFSGNNIFGVSTSAAYVPKLQSPCNAKIVVQPSSLTTQSTRNFFLTIPAGCVCDFHTLAYFTETKNACSITWGSTGAQGTTVCSLGGTLNLSGVEGELGAAIRFQSAGASSEIQNGAVINFNSKSSSSNSFGNNGNYTWTLNVNAELALTFGTAATGPGRPTINCYAKSFVGNVSGSWFVFPITINAYSAVQISNFWMSSATLTINQNSAYEVSQLNCTGTIVVNGGAILDQANVKAGVQYSLNNSGDLTTGTLNGNYSY